MNNSCVWFSFFLGCQEILLCTSKSLWDGVIEPANPLQACWWFDTPFACQHGSMIQRNDHEVHFKNKKYKLFCDRLTRLNATESIHAHISPPLQTGIWNATPPGNRETWHSCMEVFHWEGFRLQRTCSDVL